ncbi:MaoC family dehydratase [Nitratireductor sp. XY-223]|uniref:MaoC family dehydratase n=1 Tax=Nitratireductor sp. XY-223 TaxID=2561926 RepID=UPI0010A9B562|nr:MaoC family dehydratase [Nitratireductor sp. XY-223]
MNGLRFEAVNVGDKLPVLRTAPISRTTLALFAGASGDHNPIHIDIDFARSAGMEDVFAHGMLSMAYLGRLLTGWVPQTALRRFDTRFVAITQLRERIVCTGTVAQKYEEDGEKRVRLAVEAANEAGEVKLAGEAVVALP